MTNYIIFVAGKKGSGKTTFVIGKIIPKFDRVLILDSLSEYNGFICNDINHFLNVLESNYNRNSFKIIYRPLDQRDADFFIIAQHLFNVTFVIEEADIYSNPYKIDENFEKLVKYGRHYRQNIICVSRRAAEISRSITAQSDIIITFKQTEKRDLDYFRFLIKDPESLTLLENSDGFKHIKNKHFRILSGEDLAQKILAL